jgi:hypothetical protein
MPARLTDPPGVIDDVVGDANATLENYDAEEGRTNRYESESLIEGRVGGLKALDGCHVHHLLAGIQQADESKFRAGHLEAIVESPIKDLREFVEPRHFDPNRVERLHLPIELQL